MKKIDVLIFAIWFVAISVPIASMMANHTFSLNASHSKNLRQLASQKKITVLHFLGTDCDCSKNVLNHLLQREARSDVEEKVFIIGNGTNWKSSLLVKKYQVVQNDMAYFEKNYDIKAVPQLTIINGEHLLYSGGYSDDRNNRQKIEDQKIISAIIQNKKIDERPIFGCINGRDNRVAVDPLNLKYSR